MRTHTKGIVVLICVHIALLVLYCITEELVIAQTVSILLLAEFAILGLTRIKEKQKKKRKSSNPQED